MPNKNDALWLQHFEEYKNFVIEEGHFPGAHVAGVGRWLHNQIVAYRGGFLPNDRLEMLNSFNPVWCGDRAAKLEENKKLLMSSKIKAFNTMFPKLDYFCIKLLKAVLGENPHIPYAVENYLSNTSAYKSPEDMQQKVGAILCRLNTQEQTVIKLRFGLYDGRHYSLEEVGDKLGRSTTRIRQIEAKGLRKLRHPINRDVLEAGLTIEEYNELQQTKLKEKKPSLSDVIADAAKYATNGTHKDTPFTRKKEKLHEQDR